MKVPLLDVTRQNEPLARDLLAAFERVLHSGQYILGKEVEQFERAVAPLAGTRHAIGVSSGTDAILLALMTLGIGPGDEVICPSFTFFATAGCVERTGAKPVFADSCPFCFNMDVSSAERLITPRTKAVMPVHLFGQMADMDSVMALADAHNLPVIEDAAQAIGSGYRGAAGTIKPAGSIGACGVFSFFPSKNLGGFGEAGMLVTNDDALAEKARLLRSHGDRPKYFHKIVGGNFRMDPLQAALLSVKLARLGEYARKRTANACEYISRLANIEGAAVNQAHSCRQGEAPPDIRRRGAFLLLPAPHEGRLHVWNQFTVRVLPGENWTGSQTPRDALRSYLRQREIGSEIYYPRPMHRQECFASAGPHPAAPVSEALADQCLSIPVFGELTAPEKDAVIAALEGFLKENG